MLGCFPPDIWTRLVSELFAHTVPALAAAAGCPPAPILARRPQLPGHVTYDDWEYNYEGLTEVIRLTQTKDVWIAARIAECQAWLERTVHWFLISPIPKDRRGLHSVYFRTLEKCLLRGVRAMRPLLMTAHRFRAFLLPFTRIIYMQWWRIHELLKSAQPRPANFDHAPHVFFHRSLIDLAHPVDKVEDKLFRCTIRARRSDPGERACTYRVARTEGKANPPSYRNDRLRPPLSAADEPPVGHHLLSWVSVRVYWEPAPGAVPLRTEDEEGFLRGMRCAYDRRQAVARARQQFQKETRALLDAGPPSTAVLEGATSDELERMLANVQTALRRKRQREEDMEPTAEPSAKRAHRD